MRSLKTRKRTRFLFVGGLVDRKGIDVLLEAYLSSFSANDDVCLVVKPFGSGTVYAKNEIEETLRRAASANGPEIEIIEGDLDESEMAALYRSCTCLVHPYRGEGFGLPIAEAMACGLPTITTNGGAALDFCDTSTGWLIEAGRSSVTLGPLTPSVGGSWWLEPSRIGLIDAMREVIEKPDEARAKGALGAERISKEFTWEHSAARASERVRALLETASATLSVSVDTPRISADALSVEHSFQWGSSRVTNEPLPTTSIIALVGPTHTDPPFVDWAAQQISNDPMLDLIVCDNLPAFRVGRTTTLSGDRLRLLRTFPTPGLERSLQHALALAMGDIFVLAIADITVNFPDLNEIRSAFRNDPSIGVVIPQKNAGQEVTRLESPPFIAIRRDAVTSIGGPRAMSLGTPDERTARRSLLGDDTLAALASAKWATLVLPLDITYTDGQIENVLPAAGADFCDQLGWNPVEIVERPASGLNVVGLFETSCGIGDAARRYVEAAEATGIDLNTFSFRLSGSPEECYDHRGDGRLSFDTNLFVLNAGIFLPFIDQSGHGILRGHYNIILPFWELEMLSSDFEVFRLVNEIWAATSFLQSAFQTRTDKPVTLMPLPVHRREGPPRRTRRELGLPEGFVFLTTFDFASLAIRKNCSGVVAAFCQAFEPGEGPNLVLKTINSHCDPDGIQQLRAQAGRRRDILVLDGFVDDETISEMIGSADCYVSLHRSEGFGLSLAEAMAWGRPVIATDYSGNLDFMNSDNSFLIPYDLIEVPHRLSQVYPVGAHWADPRIDDAAIAMRRVFDDPEETARRATRGQMEIRATHAHEVVAHSIARRLEEIGLARRRQLKRTTRPVLHPVGSKS